MLGPSGCGKTTLARILVGIEPLDQGDVLIDGRAPGFRARIAAWCFRTTVCFRGAPVAQNVELGLELRGVPVQERREAAHTYIELVGLTGFEKYFPHQISGGMQQRALARARPPSPACC